MKIDIVPGHLVGIHYINLGMTKEKCRYLDLSEWEK